MLDQFHGSQTFLTQTAEMGVLGVRKTEGTPFIFVFVDPSLRRDQVEHITALANAHWSEDPVVVVPRVLLPKPAAAIALDPRFGRSGVYARSLDGQLRMAA